MELSGGTVREYCSWRISHSEEAIRLSLSLTRVREKEGWRDEEGKVTLLLS
jgi:hypothetical protein